MTLRVLIAGGGTGGHLFPGVAVAERLRQHGAEVTFVGTTAGIEARVLPALGWPLETIRARGLVRARPVDRLRFLLETPATVFQVIRLLGRLRPHVVAGVGGYASGPVVLLAALGQIPTAILEQNTVPGVTNRLLGRVVRAVYATFDESKRWFPERKVEVLGNPVRQSIVESLGRRVDREGSPRLRVLAFGGSQGARGLNELLMDAAPKLASSPIQLVHQTGQADRERVAKAYQEAGLDAEVLAFEPDMARRYAEADLALCRSGATTLAELAMARLPAVLIPFPYATHDHQRRNAETYASAGAALLADQETSTGASLAAVLEDLAGDRRRLATLSEAMGALARPDAGPEVARRLVTLARTRRR